MIVPKGFVFNGIDSNVKKTKDLGIIITEAGSNAIGFFTQNEYKSESLLVCKKNIKDGFARAIIVNSGCANCGLGKRGEVAALRICSKVAEKIKAKKTDILLASTGPIGIPLEEKKIVSSVDRLVKGASSTKAEDFARAIMTTDRYPKTSSLKLKSGVTILGIAKGAGMIEPNMATTLAFLLTDGKIRKSSLAKIVRSALDLTFNRISIDAGQSTNDTFLALANGVSSVDVEASKDKRDEFIEAVFKVLFDLAYGIVENGEGATKVVKIEVKSAKSKAIAEKICRKLASSMLFKSSLYGNSANWGRVLSSVGSLCLGVGKSYDISYGNIKVVKNGLSLYNNKKRANDYLKKSKEIKIILDFKRGKDGFFLYTTDLSPDYVKLNS
ncbi:MAG: bifunctional glutamate N-acetyltransferase/amino-acid acetyltransferase ArgJ [Candidatus Kaelpia imicola]|nr:bifunctional glutamate N-acetyltransferase/amino-acid acetyltransferase ArgJ [Candidatus Kaelpia imicola]